MSLWFIRILFLSLCIAGGYAISQVQPDLISSGWRGVLIGFGLGGVLVAIDEMLKGFSLRAFSAASFGLMLGCLVAWLIDQSQLFIYAEERIRWIIRLAMFLGFGYIGMLLAMRSNKEDFWLIIPYVRFTPQNQPDKLLLLDTSAIIDGRVADLFESSFVEGIVVVPRFVLRELQSIADSNDPIRRARGRRGLEMLTRLQRSKRVEVKIHEGDVPEENTVDGKLVGLARRLGATLYTNDYNLSKVAELHSVTYVNINQLSQALKPVILPGELLNLRIVREGKDKGQGVGYLPDGTMVVVNQASHMVGNQVEIQVISLLQTGAGIIVFADLAREGGAAA
ncbi:MAG TPA: twitching motility protein PilT [Candidatus Paceibacterota bacterium]|nr:twitching motility protein PilT [Verrucomicrobiota bacterium]HRY47857.1 twitching motility protein PilT [Candidatus Paceibacterota bacterium]